MPRTANTGIVWSRRDDGQVTARVVEVMDDSTRRTIVEIAYSPEQAANIASQILSAIRGGGTL